MQRNCLNEVNELHKFFQDWFTAAVPDTDEAYGRFSQTIGDDFHIIGPNGMLTNRENILVGLRAAHNAGPFEIWIENASAREVVDGLWLALYEEWQIREGVKTARQSTALFRPNPSTPNGLEWVHVHETWIDNGAASD